jgi:hypothetical protein
MCFRKASSNRENESGKACVKMLFAFRVKKRD